MPPLLLSTARGRYVFPAIPTLSSCQRRIAKQPEIRAFKFLSGESSGRLFFPPPSPPHAAVLVSGACQHSRPLCFFSLLHRRGLWDI